MTLFLHPDLQAAYKHVADGGQAVYLRKKREHEQQDAWLIDNDFTRLIGTAKQLGVRRPRVMRAQREGQCIELGPTQLYKAAIACATPEMKFV